MRVASEPLAGVRSILETPILDERKWAKVSDLPVDAVLLDLEDSVPADRKEEARDRVLECVDDPTDLGGRVGLPRVNSLDSPWGYEDLRALARHGTDIVVYPKVRDAGDLLPVRDILREHGCEAGIIAIIETAQAVLELENIAKSETTAGLFLGPSDLATDVGWSLFAGDGLFADAYHYPKSKLAIAGAAYDVPVYDTVFVPDLRDNTQVEAAAQHARRFGFTGMTTFYPPHLDIINAAFAPTDEEIAEAREIINAYEGALAQGSAAVQVNGRAIIVQDYKNALRVLSDAGE